ncbi:MAG TPA: hypothetical protein PKE25_00845 [Novosphingobium sp.]|nr:hypothetical protein [Novosphingobium sp.]
MVEPFETSPILPGKTDRMAIFNNGGTIIARESTNGGATFTCGTTSGTALAPNPVGIHFQGASSVYGDVVIGAADTFTVASGGTLAVRLPTSLVPAVAQAAYPYVNANTANLGGTLQLVLNTPNGLYGNAYVFNDIIDAEVRNGTFSSVVTNTGSALLAPTVTYDADANVDLRLARVAFGAVPGLTFNLTATGNAIEAVYSPTQGGAYGTLLANLFLQTPGTYPAALNQLSGDQHAGQPSRTQAMFRQIDRSSDHPCPDACRLCHAEHALPAAVLVEQDCWRLFRPSACGRPLRSHFCGQSLHFARAGGSPAALPRSRTDHAAGLCRFIIEEREMERQVERERRVEPPYDPWFYRAPGLSAAASTPAR